MSQQIEAITQAEIEPQDSPFKHVYRRLVYEGLEMYATIQQQPVLSGEEIAEWAAYYYTVTDMYGQLVASTGADQIVDIPFSPLIESFRETSPRLFHMLLEEATQLPQPRDGLTEALTKDPTGITWLQQQAMEDEHLGTENPGVALALMRAQTLFTELPAQ